MMFISHRGNLFGKFPKEENHPVYLETAIAYGYYVEADLWYHNGLFYLGHDLPMYEISLKYIEHLKRSALFHLKNIETVKAVLFHQLNIHYFYHDTDECTITSKGYVWCHSRFNFINSKTIIVLPEVTHFSGPFQECAGICSDNIEYYASNY